MADPTPEVSAERCPYSVDALGCSAGCDFYDEDKAAAYAATYARGRKRGKKDGQEETAWRDLIWAIHEGVVKAWKPSSPEDIRFLALALGGECGELANVLKKAWRGDFELKDRWEEIAEELADTRIYLELLARAMGYDLDACVLRVLPKLKRRWPDEYETARAALELEE